MLRKCCNQLSRKIEQQSRKRKGEERKKELLAYVPNVCKAIFNVIKVATE